VVADIIGKLESLTRIMECVNEETNADAVLVEKILQYKLRAVQLVRISACNAQGFTATRSSTACGHIRSRTG